MKRPPNRVASLYTRNYGIAYSRFIRNPVWRRSRNITQMLRVMPETAEMAPVRAPVEDGPTYKLQATASKTYRTGGSAAASYQSQSKQDGWFC
jgi:hypothetical protein